MMKEHICIFLVRGDERDFCLRSNLLRDLKKNVLMYIHGYMLVVKHYIDRVRLSIAKYL